MFQNISSHRLCAILTDHKNNCNFAFCNVQSYAPSTTASVCLSNNVCQQLSQSHYMKVG